jgi:serine/threonine protein kinase
MNTFERDFTLELEKCVQKGTADITIPKKWSPGRVAPPEIHARNGVASDVPIEAIYYQLRRNNTFQMISDLLGMQLSEHILINISKQENDEKAQVWMFGRWWFNSYAEYLLDPLTQRSSFYKERHTEFLSLMRHMLEFDVSRRLSFRAALASWFPDSDLFTKEAQSEDDDESDVVPPPAAASFAPAVPVPAAPAVPVPAASSVPNVPQPSVSVPPSTNARRLVLKGWGDSAGRNKTRKNLGS